MQDRIRSQLLELKQAGIQMAAEQYPIYLQKQTDLKQRYADILSNTIHEKEEEENNDEEKERIASMSKDKLLHYERDKASKKHVQRMTKQDRQSQIRYVMERLYYGLDDDMEVPSEYGHLVSTGNPTMDHVNRYNILLAMRDEFDRNPSFAGMVA